MTKEMSKLHCCLLLFAIAFCSLILVHPVTVKAVTINVNDTTNLINEGANGKTHSLVGQYTLKEIGATNFSQDANGGSAKIINTMKGNDSFSSVTKKIDSDKKTLQNSSTAKLTATNKKCTIEKAYLVWECAVQTTTKNKNEISAATQKAANAAVYFSKADGKVKKVSATYASVDNREVVKGQYMYSFLCMYADVTDYVTENGYGTYGVANIPWESSGHEGDKTYVSGGWGDGHGGESFSVWQLIVVENNPKEKVNAIAVSVGSQFNRGWSKDEWVNKERTTSVDFQGLKTKSWVNSKTEINGKVICVAEPSIAIGWTSYKNYLSRLYDSKSNKFYTGKMTANDISDTLSITAKNEDAAYGFGTTKITAKLKAEALWKNKKGEQVLESELKDGQSTDGWTELDAAWTTLFVYGISMEIADCDVTGDQTTTVTSSTDATVAGKLTVETDQNATGYYDGKLVVTLDDALTPTEGTLFTVYDAKNKITDKYTYSGKNTDALKWDSANHTLTLTYYKNKSGKKVAVLDNLANNSYVSYSIPCKVAANSGKTTFANSFELMADLYSQGSKTGVSKTQADGESTAIPMYRLIVKMDKTTMSKIVSKNGKSSASGKLGTVNSSSTVSGNYYTASYDVTYNYYISAAPTFKSGYEFSLWEELNEKDSTTKERKTSSGYVNDTTYAYERQMPAYNITLTITGVGEKYEVRYYMNAPVTIADTDKWKVGESFTLIGNSAKETAAKTYTGAQIKKICGKTAPYIYKTYQFGNYYSASKSSGITIKGYENVIDGTHTKDGWWTAASGGSYVDIDGAASGDNAGKIQIDAAWKKLAKDGTLSDGTKGKIICLYAHWEKRIFKVTLVKGTGVEKVSGAGTYTVGDKVKISADLKTGYHWQNWTGSYSSGTIADQTFTFTMPAQDVTLTANAEINSYTLHFDPNMGTEVTHIDDIEVTYDGQVTLPDATECYARYTLDGQDITSQVISGEIRLAADGRVLTDEEETETEETENETTDAEIEATETVDTEIEGTDNETVDTEIEDTEIVDTEIEDDTELELETEQKAAGVMKNAYASVYTGWSLEDGRTNYAPQWGYGIQVDVAKIIVAAGMTDTDGATITLYANWDDCPWIVANDLYYTLDQAQSGYITVEEILSHATASDREDGSPILPGTNPALNNPDVFTAFVIPDYSPTDFTQFTHEGSCTENLTVTDSAGSTYAKQITVYVVDTTPVAVKSEGTTRFINEYYYNQPYEYGGLEDDSIWKTDAEYVAAIQEAFSNLNNDTPEESYYFTHETVLEMKQFIEENGFGNLQSADALTRFYNEFMAPNKQ